eukprot:CAMPEP_0114655832 /NCGR_PEP_ID=MMETSP0191-20121206/11477_1 /TAXON_ID=126664 /ORGANISM="Sorites sp." /LENGTH=44 /DNA_ID= /DNA_START= /DNA_END= /DNA_ORIENTATION=
MNDDISPAKIIEYESSTSDYFMDGDILQSKHRKSIVIPSDVDEM